MRSRKKERRTSTNSLASLNKCKPVTLKQHFIVIKARHDKEAYHANANMA